MIKKSVFEDELIAGMQIKLAEVQAGQETDNLEEAIEYLNSAAQIFDDHGKIDAANKITNILYKIAKHGCRRPDMVPNADRHMKNLTPENQVRNMKHHGHQFNLSDDGKMDISDADDLLNLEIDDTLEVSEEGFESFEDEK